MLNPNLDEIQLTKDDYERYSRHLILPEVGLEGQKRLKAASVLCIGTGGLGSPLLLYLAAAGIGRIGIVDFDVVDYSNLQRQIIHGASWVGKPKIESAKNRILEINPSCQVDLYNTRISSENALELLQPYDVSWCIKIIILRMIFSSSINIYSTNIECVYIKPIDCKFIETNEC